MSPLDKIRENNAKVTTLRKQMQQENQLLLGQAIKEVFEEHADWLKSFSWTQYTPYFNDGDTCEFGVCLDYCEVNGESEDSNGHFTREYVYIDWKTKKENPNFDAIKSQVIDNLKKLIRSVGEDTLKSIFGDHVRVTATKGGFETEECDHE